MMGVKLASGVSTLDAGKQFSTGMYNRKTLGKITAMLQRLFLSNFDNVLLIVSIVLQFLKEV